MLEQTENKLQALVFKGAASLKTKDVSQLLGFRIEVLSAMSTLPRITNQTNGLSDYQKMLIEALCEFAAIIAHISQLVGDGVLNENGKLGPMIELGFLRKQIRRLTELEMVLNESKSSKHIEQIDM